MSFEARAIHFRPRLTIRKRFNPSNGLMSFEATPVAGVEYEIEMFQSLEWVDEL